MWEGGGGNPHDLKIHALYHYNTSMDMKKVIIKMREVKGSVFALKIIIMLSIAIYMDKGY